MSRSDDARWRVEGVAAEDRPRIDAVIMSNLAVFQNAGVLAVRAGYKVADGWPTREPAIVATVERRSDAAAEADRLPERIDGVAVDVRQASPLKVLELTDPASYDAVVEQLPAEQRVPRFAGERVLVETPTAQALFTARPPKPRLPYEGPAGVDLTPVEGEFTVTCHASPDAGWPTLSTFLAATKEGLTLGLYDFTSAHVLTAVKAALAGKRLDLVLDHPPRNPTADQTNDDTHSALVDALGSGLRFAWALDGHDPLAAVAIFANAYHIKVAVRDQQAFWLSSGNWNNSNQPDIDPVNNPDDASAAKDRDRDWHVIVQRPDLSRTFAAYLEHDLAVAAEHQAETPDGTLVAAEALPLESLRLAPRAFAQFFEPRTFTRKMRIQPLLTPDAGVYSGAVLDLIRSASESLYIQTQYAHPSGHPEDSSFMDLLRAVIDRQQAGVDVRLIFSQWQRISYLQQLQAVGFDLAHVRIQQGVHNKGIVCDGTSVLISSQNWSADGVLRNRDAGLIIEQPEIAQYFQAVFMHDWENLAHQHALD